MPRIDFYLDAEDKVSVAARLLHKAFAGRHRAVVLAPDRETADALDRRLWMHPPLAFLPHCRVGDPLAAETPVLFAQDAGQLRAAPHHDLLFNLGHEVPATYDQFGRVIEIVGLGEDDRIPARERFRRYRSDGHEITSHRLGTSA